MDKAATTGTRTGGTKRLRAESGMWWFVAACGGLFAVFAFSGAAIITGFAPPHRPLVLIFLFSMFLQSVAALLALRLIRITGWRTAWGFIAIAIVLMAVRRAMGFYSLLAAMALPGPPVRLETEIVALVISILMVIGIGSLAPLFRKAREAEQTIQRSERYLRTLTSALPDMTFVLDADGRFLDIVAPDERFLVAPAASVLGKTLRDMLPAGIADKAVREIRRTIETGQSRDLRYELDVPAGHRWFEGRTSLIPCQQGQPPRVMFVARDVTARVAAEEAYRVLAEQSIQGIQIYQNGHVVYVNPAGARILGRSEEEIVRMSRAELLGLVYEADRTRVAEQFGAAFRGEAPPAAMEFRLVRKDGGVIWTEALSASCLYREAPALQMVFIDITERREIDEERGRYLERLREAQKWESLSTLAGGVAHMFNNLLQSILGFTELCKSEAEESGSLREYLDEIDLAAQRASTLSAQMLACSGHGSFVFETISLSGLVRDMTQLLEALCPEHIRLTLDLNAPGAKTRGDRGHIRQLILNVVTNAIEAIGPDDGAITIETGERTVSKAELADVLPADAPLAGNCPFIEIRDSGSGMDAATRARVFDPFFSTKFTGRGLGMAAVLGIVRAHHAGVTIESEPGKGTTVRALFPAATEEGRVFPSNALEEPETVNLAGRSVLLVDDEPMVCEVGSRLLRRAGCHAILAQSGLEALELLSNEVPLECIIVDWTMPGMDTGELLRTIRETRPTLPIIVASGHTESTVRSRIDEPCQPDAFLQKPYGTKEIVAVLERVLKPV